MEIISRIQAWYARHCDGDWEHTFGIEIGNIDNPGWSLQVDLEETHLLNILFDPVEIRRSKSDWYDCFLRDGKFHGAGGAHNLEDLLRTFLDWAESNEESGK